MRLDVLIRTYRYVSGKQTITALERLRKQEKLSKVEKLKQSALVNTMRTLDVAELGASLVEKTTETGKALALDSKSVGSSLAAGISDLSPAAAAVRKQSSTDVFEKD